MDRKASCRSWYLQNKAYANTKSREWHNTHKDQLKKYRQENPHRHWSHYIHDGHKQRGHTMILTKDELFQLALQTTHCLYCGCELDYSQGVGRKKNSPSLDRVNNENEIRLDNVEIICYKCNMRKSDFTKAEFIKYCQDVGDKFKNG